jgi:endonuclease G
VLFTTVQSLLRVLIPGAGASNFIVGSDPTLKKLPKSDQVRFKTSAVERPAMAPDNKANRIAQMLREFSPEVRDLPRAPSDAAAPVAHLEFMRPAAAPANVDVDSALDKVAKNRPHELTNSEVFALEAIVMPQNRPVVFVRNTGTGESARPSYDDLDKPWTSLNAPAMKQAISKLFPSIGRIELPLSPVLPYAGTGFVVGDGLLMTNRHIAQLFSSGLGMNIKYQAGGSAIDFKRQVDTPDDDHSAYFRVVDILMIHPYWDMAILRVEGQTVGSPLPLSVASPEDLVGDDVVVIGYPGRDDRNDLDLQDRIFQRKYYVKRLQPGTVRPRVQIQSFENTVDAMVHNASTLGGDSGAAVIHVKTGRIIALHFGGEYLKANYAVPMYELARDSRVAKKLNFVESVTPTSDFDAAWNATENESPPRPSDQGSSYQVSDVNSQPSPPQKSGIHSHTWTLPLNVTVSIGAPLVEPGGAVGTLPTSEELEGVVVNQDYSDREGYDPDFLDDISVPLPRLTAEMKKITAQVQQDARKGNDQFELAYYHYSVYMNRQRRTAWFSAANVDGGHRPNIGKRQGDRWYIDTRIQRSDQLGQEAFESGIDRGHLTRREDTAWGTSVKSATAANNDTFHFTNCSLQASAFNRGKDRWQGLEQFLLEQHAKKSKKKMMVITGPLFTNNDPVYKNEKMNYAVRCPLQFWKVCVLIREDGTPSATAFILGQDEIKDLPGFEEAFDVAATQIKISELETRTRLDFGELRKHDHFAAGGPPGTLEAMAVARRLIRTVHDIVV